MCDALSAKLYGVIVKTIANGAPSIAKKSHMNDFRGSD